MKRLFSIVGLLVVLWLPHAQAADFPVTKLHKQVTAQKGWLNTSRALEAKDLRGRILLLDFWTYCCINCIQIMPDLKYLEHTFGDKLTVIGVHSAKFKNERDTENIRQAILRNDLEHPVVNDFDFSTWQAFDVHGWPTLILIGPDGNIVHTYSGEGHRLRIEGDINALIKQYGDKVNTTPLPIELEKTKAPPHLLDFPTKLVYAPDYGDRSMLFVADSGNERILAIAKDGRVVEQIGAGKAGRMDGGFDIAQFVTPQGLAYRKGVLYIADTGNHLLRAAHFSMREVSSIAGTGQQGREREVKDAPALKTSMASPWDVAFYPDEHHLVIAEAGTHQIWQYDLRARTLSVIAGNGRESIVDGTYPSNALSQPSGFSVYGDTLYFVDAETSSLRMLKDGVVTTLIGNGLFDFGLKDGKKGIALMQHPLGLAAGSDAVYVADSYNHSIRKYDIKTGLLSTLAGHGERGNQDGSFTDATFNEPNDVVLVDDMLYVADTNNHAIRVLDLKNETVSTLAIHEEQTLVDSFSEALPNLSKLPAQEVTTTTPVAVMLELADGWKINKDAPSNISLFAVKDGKHEALARFGRDKMHDKRILLPKLVSGAYRLQGTLYYCEEKAGSQCLLKSIDMQLTAGDEGVKTITLPIN